MRSFIRLITVFVVTLLGGVVTIRLIRDCTWEEAFEIADQFLADLLSDAWSQPRSPQ